MITEAINTVKALGARTIVCRGDSAFGNGKVIAAVLNAGARFSFVLTKSRPVLRAIGAIGEDAWIPVRYPGAVTDPDTGEWISDAEVAEIAYTAFAGTPYEITARLIVRRVRDRNHPDELFPVWRYHPFFTNNTEPVADADITHRQHAIIESVFADLIDGPLAHLPCGGLRGQRRLGGAGRDHPQPAARRRDPHRPHPRRRPRGDAAPPSGQRPGPCRQAPGHTNPAPTSSLASGLAMENPVGQHLHRSQSTSSGLTQPTPAWQGPTRRQQWMSWEDQRLAHAPSQPVHSIRPPTPHHDQPIIRSTVSGLITGGC